MLGVRENNTEVNKMTWEHEKYVLVERDSMPRQYKYTSTKEYHDAFPCAYRQWKADSHCNLIHGYSFSMKFFFGYIKIFTKV